MNWDAIGATGEWAGAIGVIVTLAYLAIQIRQSGRSTTFAVIQAGRDERMAWFKSNRDSPYLAPIIIKLRAGGALSEEEGFRLGQHHSAVWGFVYSQWVQRELGLAGRFATLDSSAFNVVSNTPGSSDWFKQFGEEIYPKEFCEYIETWMKLAKA